MAAKIQPSQLPPELHTADPRRVGIPGGTQHTRGADGKEERDWRNLDGTVVYRVTRPVPNPQEAAVAAAKARA